MKSKFSLLAIVLLTFSAFSFAQGGFQMPSPEERTKNVMEKLAPLKLDKDQATKTDSVFSDYHKAQAKFMEEMRGGGGDRETMRAEMDKRIADRDEKLKKVWTADQFKKFKDEIEPTLRQRRGGNQ